MKISSHFLIKRFHDRQVGCSLFSQTDLEELACLVYDGGRAAAVDVRQDFKTSSKIWRSFAPDPETQERVGYNASLAG